MYLQDPKKPTSQTTDEDRMDMIFICPWKPDVVQNSFCSVKQLIWIGSDSIWQCLLGKAYAHLGVCYMALLPECTALLCLLKCIPLSISWASFFLCVHWMLVGNYTGALQFSVLFDLGDIFVMEWRWFLCLSHLLFLLPSILKNSKYIQTLSHAENLAFWILTEITGAVKYGLQKKAWVVFT